MHGGSLSTAASLLCSVSKKSLLLSQGPIGINYSDCLLTGEGNQNGLGNDWNKNQKPVKDCIKR